MVKNRNRSISRKKQLYRKSRKQLYRKSRKQLYRKKGGSGSANNTIMFTEQRGTSNNPFRLTNNELSDNMDYQVVPIASANASANASALAFPIASANASENTLAVPIASASMVSPIHSMSLDKRWVSHCAWGTKNVYGNIKGSNNYLFPLIENLHLQYQSQMLMPTILLEDGEILQIKTSPLEMSKRWLIPIDVIREMEQKNMLPEEINPDEIISEEVFIVFKVKRLNGQEGYVYPNAFDYNRHYDSLKWASAISSLNSEPTLTDNFVDLTYRSARHNSQQSNDNNNGGTNLNNNNNNNNNNNGIAIDSQLPKFIFDYKVPLAKAVNMLERMQKHNMDCFPGTLLCMRLINEDDFLYLTNKYPLGITHDAVAEIAETLIQNSKSNYITTINYVPIHEGISTQEQLDAQFHFIINTVLEHPNKVFILMIDGNKGAHATLIAYDSNSHKIKIIETQSSGFKGISDANNYLSEITTIFEGLRSISLLLFEIDLAGLFGDLNLGKS